MKLEMPVDSMPVDSERLWRTLAERETQEAGTESIGVQPEFEAPFEEPTEPERRRFLKVMGASSALAAAASGCRWEEDKLLPFAQAPEGMVPGVPRFFSTSMPLRGFGLGLRVKSYDGRPIKIDGNAAHPDSLGATSALHQAAVLELYDPDRSHGYARRGQDGRLGPATQLDFKVELKKAFDALRSSQGAGLRVLSGVSSSPSFLDMKARFLAAFPQSKWLEYEPVHAHNEVAGAALAFGVPLNTRYSAASARVIVSFGADLLGSRPESLALSRQWAGGRQPEDGRMNRLYVFESSLSDTGSAADHRIAVREAHIKALCAYVDAEVSARLAGDPNAVQAQARPAAAIVTDPKIKRTLDVIVAELLAARGQSLLAAGSAQPPEVHAVVHRLNVLLGNVGQSVSYTAPVAPVGQAPQQQLAGLVREMTGGSVNTLVILDANPVYTAPADLDFEGALKAVANKISLGLYQDETALRCDWHVPMAHFLESWGDSRASDGSVGLQQPLIAPLYGGMSALELLALITRDSVLDGQSIVKRTLSLPERLWRQSLHDGVVAATALAPMSPTLQPLAPFVYSDSELAAPDPAKVELVLGAGRSVFDGRFANNSWLQELPEPATKLTWDNALLLSPRTAAALGVADATWVNVTVDGRTLRVPALIAPGQAPGSARLSLGYGRTAAGRVGGNVLSASADEEPTPPVGANAYRIRTTVAWDVAASVTVQATRESVRLATTQDKHTIDKIGEQGRAARLPALVRSATLEHFKEHPDFAQHAVHHPPLLSLWKEPVTYEGHKWGMSIDLNKCTGCGGCVVACQAENNIPAVGKEQVARGREMHWIRIDRYYKGDVDAPEVVHQPVPCMHCEHAPCEQVCPVGATLHSSEGVNEMTYNRCVGTRYCSNNCPYKVRRFNYFNNHEALKDERNASLAMAFNPEVTVRFRGVMEKCTYCVQRIQNGKFTAKRERRDLRDGEVTTACQDSCPTSAIVFGDLNDSNSQVARAKKRERDYSLLEELNVRPRTTYLAQVKNPHPELI